MNDLTDRPQTRASAEKLLGKKQTHNLEKKKLEIS